MTLSDVVSAYLFDRAGRGEIGSNTTRQLRCRLATLLEVCPEAAATDLDRAVIRSWQLSIGHLAPPTRRAYLSSVRVFCRWAVAEGHLGADPTVGMARVAEARHEPRALSAGQVNRLRLVTADERSRLIVELMVGCGLRCIEVARLRHGDYDPTAATIVVTGKASHQRTLPVPAGVGRLLDASVGGPGEAVIGLGPEWISRLVSGWMRSAGIKQAGWDRVSAHALRHSFASNLFDRCCNVRTVQAALGHANVATTDRYLRRATVEEIRAAMGEDWPPAA